MTGEEWGVVYTANPPDDDPFIWGLVWDSLARYAARIGGVVVEGPPRLINDFLRSPAPGMLAFPIRRIDPTGAPE